VRSHAGDEPLGRRLHDALAEQTLRDDDRLVQAARRGDVGAYERLMEKYERVAFRTAFLLTRDAGDAEEAVQDAFLKAYRALGRFHRGAPFKPWIMRIVANEAKNRRRSRVRHRAIADRALSDLDLYAAARGAEATVLADDERRSLVAALDALSEQHRDVVVSRYLLGLSEAETAEMLGLPPGTVKSRLARALERLALLTTQGGLR
jgi:RNA polymerase sigma-70 factor (ECF subfamily)